MSSARRYGVTVDDLGPVTRAARAAGLEVVGFSVHPPVAGTDDEHVDDIAAWLDVLQPDDEVWVSHLSTDGYGNLRDSWPGRRFRIRLGSALWHGDKRTLHLGADVLDVRPVRAGEHAGYRQQRVPQDGRLVMIGAGTAHGVTLLPDGRSPFHFARQRLALLEPPHMHTSMVLVPAGEHGPRAGDVVDVQHPLISAYSRRGVLAMKVGTAGPATEVTARHRLPGPDVVRAVALIGVVVMNFHGYLILRGGARDDNAAGRFFDPWVGPLSTRFAATFVLVAGVGVTLFTRGAAGDPRLVSARRWTLARRGLALYGGGLLLDQIWPGTILPYYGAMFVVAAAVFTLRTRWIVALGAAAALAAAAIAWWGLERSLDGRPARWLFESVSRSPRALLFDVGVNGTHPLLPWLAFFCAGIVLGRVLSTEWWRVPAIGGGVTLFALAAMVSASAGTSQRAVTLTSTDPFERGLAYTASALGTALVAFAVITWLADRFAGSRPVELLRHAGAMSLTLYVAHALVFNLVVDWLGWVEPAGLDVALMFAAAFWVVAITAAAWWHRRRGIGPAEWLYRQLGG